MRSSHPRTTDIRRNALLLLTAMAVGACSGESSTAPALTPTAHLTQAAGIDMPGCHPDSKLIGRVELSTADVPGTWWYITRQGFDAAGITDYKSFMERAFGLTFATFDEAVTHLVNAVNDVDENGNRYVCAYGSRGTRANYGLPMVSNYIFGVSDDDHRAR